MCGIAGAWRLSGVAPCHKAEIREMIAGMAHRGPDDSGVEIFEGGAIGTCRLSIIDLAGGHQPMMNEDGMVWVMLNGEIYNYRELRRSFEDTGRHVFRTGSDTEVLVHLYEDADLDMLHRLNGIFAFGLVDRRRARLLLARDRFGENPLFYTISDGILWFASEIGALLRAPGVSRRANPVALQGYLEDGFVPGPSTAFDRIGELPPGCWLTAESGRIETGKWAERFSGGVGGRFDEREATAAPRERILGAVGRQMVADVPIGAFPFGGIDSSTVVAAMQRVSSRPVKTFTAFGKAGHNKVKRFLLSSRWLKNINRQLWTFLDVYRPGQVNV